MFTRLGSLFGRISFRKMSEQRKEELLRWAKSEYPHDTDYAYRLMLEGKLTQLKEIHSK